MLKLFSKNKNSTKKSQSLKEVNSEQYKKTSADMEQDISTIDLREDKELLLGRCMDYLRENLMQDLEKYGGVDVNCSYPGTNNIAYLCVENVKEGNTTKCRFTTRIVRNGSKLCMMNFISKGSVEELQAYFSDKANLPELLNSWQHLSDSLEKRY